MRIILLCCVFILASCANYSNKKLTTTTHLSPITGIVTTVKELCETKVSSMREFRAGDMNIGAGCTVKGSAEDMKVNDKAYDALNALIGKIP